MKKLALFVSLAVLPGCNAAKQVGSDPAAITHNLSGRWEVVATSTMNPGVVSYVEFNTTQNGSNLNSADVQEFMFSDPDYSYFNCVGQPIGAPQGNVSASMAGSSISGSFNETSPHGGASFTFNGKLAGDSSFSGSFSAAGQNTGGCVDAGSFVATKATSLSGAYSGVVVYPDGTPKNINLTVTEDSAYNVTVTGTAEDFGTPTIAINLTGRVIGNLAQLNDNRNMLFAWSAGQWLSIVDSTGHFYGTLQRQ